MKKVIALGLVASMVLAGCSSGSSAPATTAAQKETEAKAEVKAPEAEKPAAEPAGEVIKLRYADTCNDSNPDGWGNAKFIELVTERTNGQIQIEYFDRDSLGSDKEITQSCLDGTLDMCKCSAGNMSEFSDGLAIFDLPGLFKNFEHARAAVEDSEIRQMVIDDVYADTGLYAMILEFDEPRGLATKGDPITGPDKAAGLKLRSTGAALEMSLFKQWGASSISMPFNEVYTSLQNGVIDGTYNQAYTLVQNSAAEVIDNWMQINQSWCLSAKFIGPAAIEKLGGVDSDLFKTVIECAREAEEWQASQWVDYVAESYKDMEEDFGVTVILPTEEELAPWFEQSYAIWPEYVGEGKQFSQEFIDKIQALAK